MTYHPTERPRLKIGKNEFEVTDISEGGIRFINNRKDHVMNNISGLLMFVNGETIGVEGQVVWEEKNTLGVNLNRLIPSITIIKQHQYRAQRLNKHAIKAPYHIVTK